jgi:hypothetical protein
MNVDTGELRRLAKYADEKEIIKEGFTSVPAELQEEANKELGSQDSVMVDMKKDTPLANWANQTRVASKKKAKNKMAKASRRRNRG